MFPAPLGRGALTGTVKSLDDLPATDHRRRLPRFDPENFANNMKLVTEVEKLAKEKSCTAGQIAIGWLLALSGRPGMPAIIPIPGSSKVERVRENIKEIILSDADMTAIDEILASFPVAGERYMPSGMALLDK
jgi:pyridoxine 4-dehydrogenase